MLDLATGARNWTIFTLACLTPRRRAIMSTIDSKHILIAGGSPSYGDAVVLNTGGNVETGNAVCRSDFGSFNCQGNAVTVETGHVIAVDTEGRVVYFNVVQNTLTTIYRF